jgi:hypothetical protein
MPNWVYNTLTISGHYKYVLEVKQVMSQPVPVTKPKEGSLWAAVQGEWAMEETEFSFWNVVAPPRDGWGEYFTGETWYNWNITNWGCKWDARNYDGNMLESELLSEDHDSNELTYRIETAWSPPIEFVDAMAERFPMCQIELAYEEEQGWGGERVYDAGKLFSESEYGIPESHQDYMDMGRDCSLCEWGEPADDCPGYEELTTEDSQTKLKAEADLEGVSK